MEKQKINQLKSEFFTLDELIKSSTAKRLKIDNTPNAEVLKICNMVLTWFLIL